MGFAPQYAGPHDPVASTPPRRPGWVRRTTTIDTTRPEGLDGPALVDARGRDLLTGDDGAPLVMASTSFGARLAAGSGTVEEVAGSVRPLALAGLVGLGVAAGFRARAAEALAGFPDDDPEAVLLAQLLDDLPGASLVSGFAMQHAATTAGTGSRPPGERAVAPGGSDGSEAEAEPPDHDRLQGQADLCAGWAGDSVMFTTLRRTGVIMTPLGPPAPAIGVLDDPDAWHDTAPLPPHGMRRLRRLDVGPVAPDGTAAVEVHFRDSHVDGDGLETCVHEYLVTATVDTVGSTIVAIATEARVLPWQECPGAVGSAGRVVGMPLEGLRRTVRTELTGSSTCTHLNDTLRSLQDLPHLVRLRDPGR